MSAPKFADIGKAADDLFSDDFGATSSSVTLKSKAANGANLKAEGKYNNVNGAVSGAFEAKYTHKPSGLTIKEKWNTKNTVNCDVTAKPSRIPNSEFTLATTFAPNGGGLTDIKLKTLYKHAGATTNADFTPSKATISATFGAMPQCLGWMLGVSTVIPYKSFFPTNTRLVLGYESRDLHITSSMTDVNHVEGTVFHQACSAVQAGLKFGWNREAGETTFALAGRYQIDPTTYAKVSVDKNLQAGLALVQEIRKGFTLAIAADINGRKPSDAQRLGFSITLEN